MTRRAIGATLTRGILVLAIVFEPWPVQAASLDGTAMAWPWALPFAGILLTIATGPLLFPRLWHAHYGKIVTAWAVLTLAAIALLASPATALDAFIHAMLGEYLSFIVLLFALYTVTGGIHLTGRMPANPITNGAILLTGTVSASIIGTTGAAMILIRPLIAANDDRRVNVHVVVFFIFLVANIGGALTPLGDPPLFVGYRRGVDFFWTARTLWLPTIVVAGAVLAIFLVLDTALWLWERAQKRVKPPLPSTPLRLRGGLNVVLIAAIIGAILVCAAWNPGVTTTLRGVELELQNLVRDGVLLAIAALSFFATRDEHRLSMGFSWEPIREVAKLFAGIFVCIVPVLAMLAAGDKGAFNALLVLVTAPDGGPREAAYFWVTGALSALLDNAPTYLVLFELAGGDPATLMGPLAPTLAAISMGAVYMGAMTYIGNAPNFMVYAIATERGIRMPSFFGFMLWSCAVLLPVLAGLMYLKIV